MGWVAEVSADAPVFWTRLDDTAGGCTDELGGAAGTYTGGVTLNQAGLLAGDPSNACASFDGINDYVTFADRAAFDRGDVFTLEAWIRLDVIGRLNGIVDKGSGAYVLRVGTDNRLLLRRNSIGNIVQSTITLAANTTYHLVATKNAGTVKLYVNGVDVTGAVTNQTCANNSNAFVIGAADGGTVDFIDGPVDEVAVYSTALSAARVLAHYNAGITPPDTMAPETLIDSGPASTTIDTTATLTFSADEDDCTFEGQLDGGGWEAITSPHELTDLELGPHLFEVRATDPADNTDLTPAEWPWEVEADEPEPPPSGGTRRALTGAGA